MWFVCLALNACSSWLLYRDGIRITPEAVISHVNALAVQCHQELFPISVDIAVFNTIMPTVCLFDD